jgi:hypothetical protein
MRHLLLKYCMKLVAGKVAGHIWPTRRSIHYGMGVGYARRMSYGRDEISIWEDEGGWVACAGDAILRWRVTQGMGSFHGTSACCDQCGRHLRCMTGFESDKVSKQGMRSLYGKRDGRLRNGWDPDIGTGMGRPLLRSVWKNRAVNFMSS